MFQAIDEATARHHDGTSVEILDDALRYRRGDRTLLVPLEYLYDDGESLLVIYAPSVRRWELPHAFEAIGSIERGEILAEVSAALTVLGVKHRVEG